MFHHPHHYGWTDLAKRQQTERLHQQMPTCEGVQSAPSSHWLITAGMLVGFVVGAMWWGGLLA